MVWPWFTELGEAEKLVMVGGVLTTDTVRDVEDVVDRPSESVAVTVTLKVPEAEGVQLREGAFAVEHPEGSPA